MLRAHLHAPASCGGAGTGNSVRETVREMMELIARRGVYAKLYDLQLEDEPRDEGGLSV